MTFAADEERQRPAIVHVKRVLLAVSRRSNNKEGHSSGSD
jgi:hypothetical protein